jgi:hypothetical protein
MLVQHHSTLLDATCWPCLNTVSNIYTVHIINRILYLKSPERKIPDRSLVCDFCLQTADSNRKGEPEDLLICRDCGNRGEVYIYAAILVKPDILHQTSITGYNTNFHVHSIWYMYVYCIRMQWLVDAIIV